MNVDMTSHMAVHTHTPPLTFRCRFVSLSPLRLVVATIFSAPSAPSNYVPSLGVVSVVVIVSALSAFPHAYISEPHSYCVDIVMAAAIPSNVGQYSLILNRVRICRNNVMGNITVSAAVYYY